MPVFEVGHRTDPDSVTTHLIPDMNFTYPATIVGFIVAGRRFGGEPHSKIQIWQQNGSHSCVYYRVEPDIILSRDMVCVFISVCRQCSFVHFERQISSASATW